MGKTFSFQEKSKSFSHTHFKKKSRLRYILYIPNFFLLTFSLFPQLLPSSLFPFTSNSSLLLITFYLKLRLSPLPARRPSHCKCSARGGAQNGKTKYRSSPNPTFPNYFQTYFIIFCKHSCFYTNFVIYYKCYTTVYFERAVFFTWENYTLLNHSNF